MEQQLSQDACTSQDYCASGAAHPKLKSPCMSHICPEVVWLHIGVS